MSRSFLRSPTLLLLALGLPAAEFTPTPPNQPTPTPPKRDEGVTASGTIEVHAVHDTDVYPGSTSTADKGMTPILESPRRVDAITRDLIRDLDATTATELWRLIPNAVESERGTVIVRGFTLDQRPASGAQLFDGVKASVYNLVPVNLYNIERVEMLKGPSGVMYGQGQPGGMVNFVLKKPKTEQLTEVSTHLDSYGKKQAAIDSTGPVASTDHGDFLYRLNVTAEQSETFRNYEEFKNFRAAPVVTWIPSQTTTLTFLGEAFKDTRTGGRGYGTPVRQGDPFAMPRNYTIADPNDFRETKGGMAQLQLAQGLSDDLTLFGTAFATQCKYWNQYHEGQRNAAEDAADNPTFRRQYRDQTSDTRAIGSDVHLVWDRPGDVISHRALVGTDFTDIVDPQFPAITASTTNPVSGANPDGASSLDLDNPYALPGGTGSYGVDSSTDDHGEHRELGGYGSYRIDWDKQVFLSAGLRIGTFHQTATSFNRLTNTQNYSRHSDDSYITYDGGLVWKFHQQASLYYGYSTGYQPQGWTSIDNPNGPFDPLTWDQHEVGLNGESAERRFGASLAIFQIIRDHELVPDTSPSAPSGASIDVGQTLTQGVEASLRGRVAENTTITLAYGFLQGEVHETTSVSGISGNSLEGEALAGVPEHTANITVGHTLDNMPIRLFASWTYIGTRKARLDSADPLNFHLPHYAILDIGATYLQPSWQARLGVNNVLDEDYAVLYRATGHQVNRGDPQTFTLSFTGWF